jgi:hypothetical protein
MMPATRASTVRFLAMENHGLCFLLFHDDDGQWYAAPPGFQSLLRHPIGRGSTRIEAFQELLAHPEFIHRASMGEWSPEPRLEDFVEMRAPRWTTWTAFRSSDSVPEDRFSSSAYDPSGRPFIAG